MWVSTFFVWFIVYSVLGWVYESTYCTINERKWENRGFLYGPCCPIYGTGITAMLILWQYLTSNGMTLTWYQIFILSFLGSAVLEYTTHWALEKLFHAYWWDYSNMPFNLNGRICLPASILFGLGGLMVVYVLYEPTMEISADASPMLIEFLSLMLCAILAADTAITVSALNRIARAASAINRSVNEHMDHFVAGAVERGEAAAQQLQERRDGAAQAIADAAGTVLDAGAAVSERIVQGIRSDDTALEGERERFAAELRDRLLGGMGHYVRAAARRVKGFSPLEHMKDVPGAEQFSKLMGDARAKHWPHNENKERKAA